MNLKSLVYLTMTPATISLVLFSLHPATSAALVVLPSNQRRRPLQRRALFLSLPKNQPPRSTTTFSGVDDDDEKIQMQREALVMPVVVEPTVAAATAAADDDDCAKIPSSYLANRFPLLHACIDQQKPNLLRGHKQRATAASMTEYAKKNGLHQQVDHDDDLVALTTTDRLAAMGVALLAAAALATAFKQAFLASEIMQSWRYSWPLGIGCLYMYDGVSAILSRQQHNKHALSDSEKTMKDEESFSKSSWQSSTRLLSDILLPIDNNHKPVNKWLPYTFVAAGAGLVIGGAADAWLPVWVTGPNFITAAGLAPDSAAYLLTCQVVSLLRPTPRQQSSPTAMAVQVVLLAQLYILGAGSLDDVVTQSFEVVNRALTLPPITTSL